MSTNKKGLGALMNGRAIQSGDLPARKLSRLSSHDGVRKMPEAGFISSACKAGKHTQCPSLKCAHPFHSKCAEAKENVRSTLLLSLLFLCFCNSAWGQTMPSDADITYYTCISKGNWYLSPKVCEEHPTTEEVKQVISSPYFQYFAVGGVVQSESFVPTTTPHDYALSRIKAYMDYQKARGVSNFTSYRYMTDGHDSSFNVTADGKIDLQNITLEDAFLLMYAQLTDKSLQTSQEWDAKERAYAEARADLPPTHIKVGPQNWHVYDRPAWSKDTTLLADTNCGLKRIRVLETGENKQDSMLHEMLHVASGCSTNLELHQIIYLITPKLLKMLQQNPDLVEYLTKKKTDTVWPVLTGTAHIVLDPVQAAQQDRPIPVCTADSQSTCYDPTAKHIAGSLYNKKENCERMEGVACTRDQALWAPIGKPVFEETTR